MRKYIHILLLITPAIIFTASCSREPVPPPEPEISYLKIKDLRKMYEAGITVVDTNVYIQGIITLTPEFRNLPSFVAYIQDSTAAICLTVTGTNTFTMNSEVKVFCRDVGFTDYNGLLQFGDISITDQTEMVSLTPPAPVAVPVTMSALLSGDHQGEYVEIRNVQFRDQGTFSGTRIVTDCSSNIDLYTRSDATFSGQSLPAGNGTLKGVASAYNSIQLLLRDPSELSMTGNRCGVPAVTYVSQNFNTLTTNFTNVSTLPGWKTFPEAGGRSWYSNKTSSLGPWIQATAFNTGQASVITWMIAPQVDLTAGVRPYVQFESANGYNNGATLELYASANYTGSSTPWTSTWTKLEFTQPPVTTSGYSQFVSSGQVDLSSFNGSTIYIAWVYKGADPTGTASDKTTTWEVDNVVIAEK